MREHERPTLAPTRRGLAGILAGAAALAPSSGAIAALAAPDGELIALGRDLETTWTHEREVISAAGDDVPDEIMDTYCGRTSAVVDRIEALSATTLAGLRVKLRALEWCLTGDPINCPSLFGRESEEASTDLRLVVAILNDLRTVA